MAPTLPVWQVPGTLQLGSLALLVVQTALVTAQVPLVVHCAFIWHAVVAGFGLVHVPLNVQSLLLPHAWFRWAEFWHVLPVPLHWLLAVHAWFTGNTHIPGVQSLMLLHVVFAGELQKFGLFLQSALVEHGPLAVPPLFW